MNERNIASRKAFTLVELLVVIAIMAVLLTMLLPAIQRARAQGKTVVCATHLRQMAIAMRYYTDEYNDKTMDVGGPGGTYWFYDIAPFIGDQNYAKDPAEHLHGVMEIAYCPETSEPAMTNRWGSAKRPWSFRWGNYTASAAEGSYAINAWMQPNGFYKASPGDWNYDYYYRKYSQAPAETPIFTDGLHVDAWPLDTDIVTPPYDGEGGAQNHMWRVCLDRHNMSINVGFVDTRVERTELGELWNLKWHKKFKTKRMFLD